MQEIVAACMHELDQVGVVTIASRARSLVCGKTVTKDSHGFVLLQLGGSFDDRLLITQSAVFENHYTVKYRPEVNKGRPRIRAALK